jgi:hypothetical protein
MTTERGRHLAAHPGSPYQSAILARIRPILVGHAVDDLATAQPPPRRRPSPADASAGPARPTPASIARLRLGQTTNRRGHRGGDHADPTVRLPPHRHAPRPLPARTQRTGNARTLDAGQADGHTGHGRPRWTGHTRVDNARLDHWTSTPDTGRRMWEPGLGRGRVTGHGRHRTSWATTPSGGPLRRRTAFLWMAPAAPGNHDGSAVRHLPARDHLPHYQPVARSLAVSQAAPRRTAVLE